jgi:hypothetical protein
MHLQTSFFFNEGYHRVHFRLISTIQPKRTAIFCAEIKLNSGSDLNDLAAKLYEYVRQEETFIFEGVKGCLQNNALDKVRDIINISDLDKVIFHSIDKI